jgi:adenylate cyclase
MNPSKQDVAQKQVMVSKRFFPLLLLLLSLWLNGFSQTGQKDTATVNQLLDKSKASFGEDPVKAIAFATQARDLAARLKFQKGEATALKNIGIGYYFQQKYVEALDYWHQSLALFEKLHDEVGISNLLNNISAVYKDKGDDAKALEYCLQALKLAEKTGDKLRMLSSLITAAAIYHNTNNPKAIDYLMKALPISKEIGNKESHAILLGNIGEVYFDRKEDDKALPFYKEVVDQENASTSAAFAYNGIGKIYLRRNDHNLALKNHEKALAIAEKAGDKISQLQSLKGIANVHLQQADFPTAFAYFTKAKDLGEEIDAKVELKDLYQELSDAYSQVADYRNAFLYRTKYADVKDTIYNLETAKKLGRLQFDFDLYKKEGEIKLLTNEKKLNAVELQRQRQAKTAFAIGVGLLVLIAFIILRGYRHKVKINKVLDKQRGEIQTLLSNILPAEVAKELQENGRAVPRSYERVSVLFSDFRNFTVIAEKMSPEELVKELNVCFVAFDDIIEKYKLEKIKTIGDAYMCAGGIPTTDISHPFRIVKAALEIQAYMKDFNLRRKELGLEPLEMRIGIHVGPVVAGVVGKKKYAYDIWGSTVNIASRMESNGEPGKVNISAATYDIVKEEYICTHRGKLYAKNVGEIDMYFVQEEITLPQEPLTTKPAEPHDDLVYAG